MNTLNELPIGNACKPSGEIVFRSKGIISDDYIAVIPIKQFFYINKNIEVHPVALVKDYDSSSQTKAKQLISQITSGTIVWTGNELGLNQLLVITNKYSDKALMVAALGEPKLLPSISRIVDLGPIEEYSGLNASYSQLKYCPNCGNQTLNCTMISNKDSVEFITGTCLNCKCTINGKW